MKLSQKNVAWTFIYTAYIIRTSYVVITTYQIDGLYYILVLKRQMNLFMSIIQAQNVQVMTKSLYKICINAANTKTKPLLLHITMNISIHSSDREII